MPEPHVFTCRVYFEDTDAGGIVYYANYLKFIERARTEMLRAGGVDHAELIRTQGLMFVVKSCAVDYHAPARLDDVLDVHSRITAVGGASLTLAQDVRRGPTLLAEGKVVLVCITSNGRPCRIPATITDKIVAS